MKLYDIPRGSRIFTETEDGRDLSRLMEFIPEEELKDFEITLKEEFVGKHEHIPFTKENVLKQLKDDVAFGFEKALNQRGLSSGMMAQVVMMIYRSYHFHLI